MDDEALQLVRPLSVGQSESRLAMLRRLLHDVDTAMGGSTCGVSGTVVSAAAPRPRRRERDIWLRFAKRALAARLDSCRGSRKDAVHVSKSNEARVTAFPM